ncbi:MAG TPA: MFS transporter [Thermofilaceae archaeon]|nr:MFS transporter [Thermofilaceae archaeon]
MKGEVRVLALASAAAFLGTAAFRVSVPLVAYYVREGLGGAMVEVGGLTTAFFMARAIAALLTGRVLEERVRVSVIATLSFAANAVVVQLYMLASSWLHVVLLKMLQGLLNGFAWVSIQYALGVAVRSSLKGRAYSTYFALGSLGSLAGNAAYSLLGAEGMWATLAVSTLLFAATAVTAALIPEPPHAPRAERTKARRSGILNLQAMAAVASIRAASSLIGGDLIYVYLREAGGMSRQLAALVVGLSDAVGVAVSFAVSWIADKRSDLAAMVVTGALALGGGTLFAFSNPLTMIAGYVLFALGARSLTPLARRVAVTYAEMKGVAVGAVNAAGNFSAAASAPLIGGLLDALDFYTVNIVGVEVIVVAALVDLMLVAGVAAPLALLAELKHG